MHSSIPGTRNQKLSTKEENVWWKTLKCFVSFRYSNSLLLMCKKFWTCTVDMFSCLYFFFYLRMGETNSKWIFYFYACMSIYRWFLFEWKSIIFFRSMNRTIKKTTIVLCMGKAVWHVILTNHCSILYEKILPAGDSFNEF